MSGDELVRFLIENDYRHVGWRGDHIVLVQGDNLEGAVHVPMHRELHPNTLSRIVRKAGLKEEFKAWEP